MLPKPIILPVLLLVLGSSFASLDYGDPCTTDPGAEECAFLDNGLECIMSRCKCPPLRKYWQPFDWGGSCIGIIEAVDGCDPNSNASNNCADHSTCGPDAKCHCNVGKATHVIQPDGSYHVECMLDFDDDCGTDETRRLSCNSQKGLDCMYMPAFGNKCKCANTPTQEYDTQKRTCAAVEGHPCLTDQTNFTCLTGLECRPVAVGSNVGTCVRSYIN